LAIGEWLDQRRFTWRVPVPERVTLSIQEHESLLKTSGSSLTAAELTCPQYTIRRRVADLLHASPIKADVGAFALSPYTGDNIMAPGTYILCRDRELSLA
jgi:hypothetical protein